MIFDLMPLVVAILMLGLSSREAPIRACPSQDGTQRGHGERATSVHRSPEALIGRWPSGFA